MRKFPPKRSLDGPPHVSLFLRDMGVRCPSSLMFTRHRHSQVTSLHSTYMADGLHRFYGGSDLHFLTFSCYQRRPLFSSEARCDLFLEALERVRRRYRLVVLGYVVMPEHVHLLVSEPQRETLSTAIQALKVGFFRSLLGDGVPRSRKIGETWGTPDFSSSRSSVSGCAFETSASTPKNPVSSNRFWQARFYDFNVWTEKKRIEKLRYIHRNPVKRGLVTSPEQ
jgi:putative transposase